MPEFTNLSIVEFYILLSVAGCLWSNEVKSGHLLISVFPLLNVLHISASADDIPY